MRGVASQIPQIPMGEYVTVTTEGTAIELEKTAWHEGLSGPALSSQ